MITVHLANYLRTLSGGQGTVTLDGSFKTVADALAALWRLHHGVRHRVVDKTGRLRQHVNVFVGQESVRSTGRLDTPINDGAELSILPAVSGGF